MEQTLTHTDIHWLTQIHQNKHTELRSPLDFAFPDPGAEDASRRRGRLGGREPVLDRLGPGRHRGGSDVGTEPQDPHLRHDRRAVRHRGGPPERVGLTVCVCVCVCVCCVCVCVCVCVLSQCFSISCWDSTFQKKELYLTIHAALLLHRAELYKGCRLMWIDILAILHIRHGKLYTSRVLRVMIDR